MTFYVLKYYVQTAAKHYSVREKQIGWVGKMTQISCASAKSRSTDRLPIVFSTKPSMLPMFIILLVDHLETMYVFLKYFLFVCFVLCSWVLARWEKYKLFAQRKNESVLLRAIICVFQTRSFFFQKLQNFRNISFYMYTCLVSVNSTCYIIYLKKYL